MSDSSGSSGSDFGNGIYVGFLIGGIVAIVLGYVVGTTTISCVRDDAIRHGLGAYYADPKTGSVAFHWHCSEAAK